MAILVVLLLVGMAGVWLASRPDICTLAALLVLGWLGMTIEDKIDDYRTNPADRHVTVQHAETTDFREPGAILSLTSNIKHNYTPRAAICSIVGPLYYDRNGNWYAKTNASEPASDYVGDRRLLLAMYPSYYAPKSLQGWIPDSKPVVHYNTTPDKINFFATTPSDVLAARDNVEWCVVGEDMEALAKSVGLTISPDGVIANRFQWLRGGTNSIPSKRAYAEYDVIAGFAASLVGYDHDDD
jgi:hypothetical protein